MNISKSPSLFGIILSKTTYNTLLNTISRGLQKQIGGSRDMENDAS